MTEALIRTGIPQLVLRMHPAIRMDDRQFFEFCQQNPDLRIECTAEGDLEIMPPTGWESSNQNATLTHLVTAWALGDGTGAVSDSSGGFILPNGAKRAPAAAWVRKSRLRELTAEQKRRFLPLCPDFVIELRSPSDSLTVLDKMREYIENGATLGWLLDAPNKQVYVYRPNAEVERLDRPTTLSGELELPGFVLDLNMVWETSF